MQHGSEKLFKTVIFTSVTHIVAQFTGAILYARYGLKTALSYSFRLAGFGGMIMYLYGLRNEESWIFTVLIFMMNFGVASVMNLCYIGHKGCFPTLFATSSFGYCNFYGGLAAIGSLVFP